jgi:hypothetical protein
MVTIETGQIDFTVIAKLVGLFMSKSNKRSTGSDILIYTCTCRKMVYQPL